MTQGAQGSQQTGMVAGFLAGQDEKDHADQATQGGGGPLVGADDAAADAARSGGDVEVVGENRDTDGVPVGEADADADAARGGGHRD